MKILIVLFVAVLLISCTEPTAPEVEKEKREPVYYWGEEIPGTRTFWPLQMGSSGAFPRVSPNGKYVVYNKNAKNLETPPGLYIMEISDTTSEKLFIERGGAPNWSPDSKWIVFHLGHLYAKNIYNGDMIQLTEQGNNYDAVYSPDGKFILFNKYLHNTSEENGQWIMDHNGSNKRKIGKGVFDHNWFSNGKDIFNTESYSSQGGYEFRKFNISDSTSYRLCLLEKFTISHAVLSPDNKYVSFSGLYNGGEKRGIWLMRLGSRSPILILEPIKGTLDFGEPSWYPDSKHIIYEHLNQTKYEESLWGSYWEGYFSFYKMNIDSALAFAERNGDLVRFD